MNLTVGQQTILQDVSQFTGVNLYGIEGKIKEGNENTFNKKIQQAQSVMLNSEDEDEATPLLTNIAIEIQNLT